VRRLQHSTELSLFALSLAAVGVAHAQDPIMRVDVRLVRVVVTVKDPSGALVGSLEKPDFKVFDNGVPQEISFFERPSSSAI